jgi:hypothetical protein
MHSPAIGQRGCSNKEFRSWKVGRFVPDRLIEHTAEPGLRNIDAGIHMACYLVEQRNVAVSVLGRSGTDRPTNGSCIDDENDC